MYSVYAIRSELDGRIYVGFTDCIERRIKEHMEKIVKIIKQSEDTDYDEEKP